MSETNIGNIKISYTPGKGFTYHFPEKWTGKKVANWKKRKHKEIVKSEEKLLKFVKV